MKRLIGFFLLTLLCFTPLPKSLGIPNSNHIIAGYGPVAGDLVLPSSTVIKDNKLYVLDQYGVSVFDLVTKQFLSRFPVDLGDQGYPDWEKPDAWINTLRDFSDGAFRRLLSPFDLCTARLKFSKKHFYAKPKMCIDSFSNLYILTSEEIQVFSLETGSFLRKITFQKEELNKNLDKNFVLITFKIYQDKIYLMITTSDPYDILSNQIRVLSLDGNLLRVINLELDLLKKYEASQPDFILMQNYDLIGIIMNDSTARYSESNFAFPIHFFTLDGQRVAVRNNLPFHFISEGIEYNQDKQIVLSGYSLTLDLFNTKKAAIISLQIKDFQDGVIDIEIDSKIQLDEFGLDCMDLALDHQVISVITSGDFGEIWNFKVLLVMNGVTIQYGSTPNKEGQICGSMSFAIDSVSNLFTTNIGQSVVNRYDEIGQYQNKIDMDLNLISPFFRDTNSTPVILDMILENSKLYLTNIDPDSICSYSLESNTWDIQYHRYTDPPYQWVDMQYYKDTMFLLNDNEAFNGVPSLYRLKNNNNISFVKGFSRGKITHKSLPLFIGFAITDQEYQFLDCVNQTIWIYDNYTQNLKETIHLPKDEKSFYSSFDLYPDGSWIVTDVTQCRLLHISRKGDIIETIGSKGQVELGTTKEAYLEKPDQFYLPIRAKIANNKIYVSDFGNFRYHIIPIQQKEEQRPQVEWEKDSLTLDQFPIFSEKTFDFNFMYTSSRDSEVQVSVSAPWMELGSSIAKTSDKKISVKILGSKLTPWQTNNGIIKVIFPGFLNLDKEIPITVSATGNILTLTIGSSQATLNGQAITLDSASIPLLKKGRTFVGIRLMGEMVFSNTAKISFDAKTQTVYFEIGHKKIELVINQPYALVNGAKVPLDAPPFIQAGRTFVPLRLISENLDASVDYDSKAQSITITYPKRK